MPPSTGLRQRGAAAGANAEEDKVHYKAHDVAAHDKARDIAAESTSTSTGGDPAERTFIGLLLLQIAFAAACVAVFISFLRLDALAPFRERAHYFVETQHVKQNWAHAGPRDLCFVVSAFVVIVGARALFQFVSYYALVLLRPELSTKVKVRFSEQAWCTFYYGGAAAWGLSLLRTQPYGFSSAQSLWEGFPHYLIDPAVKRYYLTVFAFWFAQIFIIFLEERRKDHWQMLTHHFVTCMLVLGSYVCSYTRIGHLVMIMMDSVDIFLSLAKCTKYLKCWGWVTDAIFVVFLVAWVVLRHIVYMYEMIYGAFPAMRMLRGRCAYVDGVAVQCFSPWAHYFFFALALALQAITIMWLVLIIKVVVRVVRGDGAADSRSDSSE